MTPGAFTHHFPGLGDLATHLSNITLWSRGGESQLTPVWRSHSPQVRIRVNTHRVFFCGFNWLAATPVHVGFRGRCCPLSPIFLFTRDRELLTLAPLAAFQADRSLTLSHWNAKCLREFLSSPLLWAQRAPQPSWRRYWLIPSCRALGLRS